MNKKGFIFIETVVVLVVLMTSVISLYTLYNFISTNLERRKYYDNISDIYKTDIIRELLKDTTLTFLNDNNKKYLDISLCENKDDIICKCMNELNIETILINNIPLSELKKQDNTLKNSMKDYLNTIYDESNKKYVIVSYKYNERNYYASLDYIEGV